MKKTFHLELDALCEVCDLGPGSGVSGSGVAMVHWCHVQEGSAAHLDERLRVGQPCCRDRAQSAERTVVPLINLLVRRPWDVAAVSRWTYVSHTLKRMLLGYAAQNILADALCDMK